MWNETYGMTIVHLIIGTHDRPQEVREALAAVHQFVTDLGENVKVTVLFSTSHKTFLAAYRCVEQEFKDVSFVMKDETSYFRNLMGVIKKSDATNIVILSDDSIFFRTTEIRKYATLQNLLQNCADDQRARFSVQFRIASKDHRPQLLAELLPTWGGPHVHVTDCSRELHRSIPERQDTFYPVCYDRHIDGPMFSKSIILQEFMQISARYGNPKNPGVLEAIWIEWSFALSGFDYAVFPVDRVVTNVGMSLSTVRDDPAIFFKLNQTNMAAEESERVANAKKIVDGCGKIATVPGELLVIDTMQNSGAQRVWVCPSS